MSKTPIDPKDIREGDLVRFEYADNETDGRADEYRATHDGHNWVDSDTGRFYLLDRPKPPVELPTEPTLGWLTYAGTTIFGNFRAFRTTDSIAPMAELGWQATEIAGDEVMNSYGHVTAFTPATAVPTEALDELRRIVVANNRLEIRDSNMNYRVRAFLAAVDKAANA